MTLDVGHVPDGHQDGSPRRARLDNLPAADMTVGRRGAPRVRASLGAALVVLVVIAGLILPGLAEGQSATAVDAGLSHTCALTSGGAVWCWGSNRYGQLGDGTTTNRSTPVPVTGLASGVVTVAAGYYSTCALTSGGAVWCWGNNYNGQLGDGTTTDRLTPVAVSGLGSGVVSLTTGGGHVCALTISGAVWCWGANQAGQLGDGTTADRQTAVSVTGLTTGVEAVGGGNAHTCALMNSGAVWCWGNNYTGQLGDGTTIGRLTPVPVSGLPSDVAKLIVGDYDACVLTTGGAVWCWGGNFFGQLGDETTTDRSTPVAVTGMGSGVDEVGCGAYHTCAVTSGGAARCWGENTRGQLGDGTTTNRSAPVPVIGMESGVMLVTGGNRHTCAVKSDGAVWCWGRNVYSELGDGTTTDRLTPVTVVGITGAPPPHVTDVQPGAGPTAGGTPITITGTGFQAGATVKLDGVFPASQVAVTSATTITAVTPAHGVGAVTVTVTNPDAQSGSLNAAFTYRWPLTISSILPDWGPTTGGTVVTILGTGFMAGASVTVGGLAAASVSVVDDTAILAMTPAHGAGAVTVTVTNPDTQSVSRTPGFTYVVVFGVGGIAPAWGPTTGGTAVTITGTGFMAGATVTFGGAPATGVVVLSATTIAAVAPAHAWGVVDIVVSNPGGGTTTLAGGFAYRVMRIRRDVDGDQRTDVTVFRPATGEWWGLFSSAAYDWQVGFLHATWGGAGDVPVPGDYDGDGQSDLVVFRPATGEWWGLLSSQNYDWQGGYLHAAWGAPGDVPVPGDYDGDGRSDLVVFRPATGDWWGLLSSHNYDWQAGYLHTMWGTAGDVPVPGDYDGDGKADLVVFRPATGDWWGLLSSHNYDWQAGYLHTMWGAAGDVPVPGDYDGDALADLVVFRPATGDWWGALSSHHFEWQPGYLHAMWGAAGDVPVSGDYDGDGLNDLVVFRPSTGDWWGVLSSHQYEWQPGYLHAMWGAMGDVPLAGIR